MNFQNIFYFLCLSHATFTCCCLCSARYTTSIYNIDDIQHRRTDRPVAKHFCQSDHSIHDLTIMVVEKIYKNDANYRRRKESHWIKILRSLTPHGLNINSLSHTPSVRRWDENHRPHPQLLSDNNQLFSRNSVLPIFSTSPENGIKGDESCYPTFTCFLKTSSSLTKPDHTGETSRMSEGLATHRDGCVQRELLCSAICCIIFFAVCIPDL